jgi:integrase
MVVAALDTGMRRGEITHQLWEDIDFQRRLLSVTRSKTPEGEAREIPLTDRLNQLLSKSRKSEGIVIAYHDEPVRIIKRAWGGALRRGGIRHVRFHDLRHTFNTRLMEAGVLQEVRMALMGHSTGKSVHSIYTHIELPNKREAIRKLEAWVKQQREELQHQKEKEKARTQSSGTQSDSGQAAGCPQTLEEENAR